MTVLDPVKLAPGDLVLLEGRGDQPYMLASIGKGRAMVVAWPVSWDSEQEEVAREAIAGEFVGGRDE